MITKKDQAMQKILIITGFLFLAAGLLWPWIVKIPLGRLPGDILVNRPGLRIFVPITSMLIVSILVSIILWIFRR